MYTDVSKMFNNSIIQKQFLQTPWAIIHIKYCIEYLLTSLNTSKNKLFCVALKQTLKGLIIKK